MTAVVNYNSVELRHHGLVVVYTRPRRDDVRERCRPQDATNNLQRASVSVSNQWDRATTDDDRTTVD